MTLSVAVDTGPLIGPRTGIGTAVAHLLDAVRNEADAPVLMPYVLSFRAPLQDGVRRLPFPAALAHRLWERHDIPRVDRILGRPALVHGTNYVVPPAGVPRLVTVYDCWFLREPGGVHPDVARAGRVLLHSIERGAVVHTSSSATAESLAEFCRPERIEVIPLGHLPIAPPPPTRPAVLDPLGDVPFIVSIGTIERRKNVAALVRAWELIAGEEPTLALVIAGAPGNDRHAIDDRLAALHPELRTRVHDLGRIDEPTKSWLLHHARALAYPSLDEGFGFPILEAMGVGTPVVASSVGSIPEVAGDAAELVPLGDDAALATALLRAHRDGTRRGELIELGRAQAAKFSWTRTAREMIALYHSLAMESSR